MWPGLDLLETTEPGLLSPFPLEVSSTNSDIERDEEKKAAARKSRDKLAVVSTRRKATVWKVPLGMDLTQVMSGLALQFFCTMHENYGLHEKCRHSTPGIWSSVRKNQLYSTDSKILLASECSRTRVLSSRSTTQHAKDRNGVCALQTSGEKPVAET